jgi:hypothetical protein|tara:strand:+ start:754 stop:1050 length:297 start_codon:yes stop_codon:yes gene_type:complete
MSYNTVQLTREKMKDALLGEQFKRVGSPSGKSQSPSSGFDIAAKVIKPSLAALAKRRKKQKDLKDDYEVNPSSMKSWSEPDIFGFGGYSRKDIPDDWA